MMTPAEKDTIRDLPCGTCGSVPPFQDGSRCHPHRLVPSKGYVEGNVVPRCPECHAAEPGHKPMTKLARQAGLKGGVARMAGLTPAERAALSRAATAALTPTEHSANSRRGALALNAKLTPEQRVANASKAAPRGGRALRASLTTEEYS